MVKSIKELWCKFLIWLNGGIPPSVILEECHEKLINEFGDFEMYICCRKCKHIGNVVYQEGHRCRLHDCFISYNDFDSVKLMFKCQDCELSIPNLLDVARYMKTISFEIVFDDYFRVMNDMGVSVKDELEFNRGFVKDPLKAFNVHKVKNNHIIGYKILFDGFPVYYCERKEEVEFILKGLGVI